MVRLAVAFLLLSVRALAGESCAADGTCQADEAEASALLQSSAAQKAKVTEHGGANTTETTTLTCYPNAGTGTCGNPDVKCFLDTTNCSTTGAGKCCKAAGNDPALAQCKFCDTGDCGACPTCRKYGQSCGQWGSTNTFEGYCCSGLECQPPTTTAIGAPYTCRPPTATPYTR